MSPQRLDSLPHFVIARVQNSVRDTNGYISYELHGAFDHLEGVREGRGYLLLSSDYSLCGDLTCLDSVAKTATFSGCEEKVPLAGSRLPYVDGWWDPYKVWLVADVERVWTKAMFVASDAEVRFFKDDKGQRWRELTPLDPSRLPDSRRETLEGGWDHEHCMLCNSHIYPGGHGYHDPEDHWACVGCFDKYVATHDLSFVRDFGYR